MIVFNNQIDWWTIWFFEMIIDGLLCLLNVFSNEQWWMCTRKTADMVKMFCHAHPWISSLLALEIGWFESGHGINLMAALEVVISTTSGTVSYEILSNDDMPFECAGWNLSILHKHLAVYRVFIWHFQNCIWLFLQKMFKAICLSSHIYLSWQQSMVICLLCKNQMGCPFIQYFCCCFSAEYVLPRLQILYHGTDLINHNVRQTSWPLYQSVITHTIMTLLSKWHSSEFRFIDSVFVNMVYCKWR